MVKGGKVSILHTNWYNVKTHKFWSSYICILQQEQQLKKNLYRDRFKSTIKRSNYNFKNVQVTYKSQGKKAEKEVSAATDRNKTKQAG